MTQNSNQPERIDIEKMIQGIAKLEKEKEEESNRRRTSFGAEGSDGDQVSVESVDLVKRIDEINKRLRNRGDSFSISNYEIATEGETELPTDIRVVRERQEKQNKN